MVYCCRDGEVLIVDEEVEEAARDLLELNDDGSNFNIPRKRPRCERVEVMHIIMLVLKLLCVPQVENEH